MSDASFLSSISQPPADLLASSGNQLDGKVRAAQSATGDKRKAELKKVAQEFEAVFIAQMLKVMRETIEEAGSAEGGFGKSIYTEMFDQEIALNMARHGTLGIANILYQNLASTVESEEKKSGETQKSESVPDQSAPSPAAPKEQSEGGKPECEIADFQLPVHAPISSAFGMRKDPFSHQARFHKGLDLAAPAGMKVVPALPGTVITAGYERGYGNTVVIQHAGGIQTRYGHLASITVKAGEVVAAQSALGTVGDTGRSTGPHLHFEVVRMGTPVNPILSYGATRFGQGSGNLKTGG
jgi:murein DD-endopeptidase MepM/ murein hydrolase activator NlpD